MAKTKLKKIAIVCIVAVCVVAAGGIGIYKNNKIQAYNKLINTANEYMDSGEYDKAIVLFNESLDYKKDASVERSIKLAENLKSAKDIYDEGIKFMNANKYLEAMINFGKIAKEDNKLYSSAQKKIEECKNKLMAMANDAVRNNKFDEANQKLDEILKIDTNNSEAKTLKDTVAKAIKDAKDQQAEESKQAAASSNKSLSQQEAIEIVKNKFKPESSNTFYAYDHDSNHDGKEFYVIHVYESQPTHTATLGWYGVDKTSGRIYDELFSNYIN